MANLQDKIRKVRSSKVEGTGPVSSGEVYGSMLSRSQAEVPEVQPEIPEVASPEISPDVSSATSRLDTLTSQLDRLRPGEVSREEYQKKISDVQDAIAQARKAYEEKGSRSEWAELAETIGRGLVKIGTAQKAMKEGFDISGFDWGKPTDWEARRERYGREYERELSQAEREAQRTEREQEAREKARERTYSDQLSKLKTALGTELDRLRLESAEKTRTDAASGKADPFELAAYKQELSERTRDVKEQREVVSNINQYKELTDKIRQSSGAARKAYEKELSDFLSKAKLPVGLTSEIAKIDEEESKWFGSGISEEEAARARGDIYNKAIEEQRLKLQKLRGGSVTREQPLTSSGEYGKIGIDAGGGEVPEKMVRVRVKRTGETGTIPLSKYEKQKELMELLAE